MYFQERVEKWLKPAARLAPLAAQKMGAVPVENAFLHIAYVSGVSLKDDSPHAPVSLTGRLRWYLDDGRTDGSHHCSDVVTLNPSAVLDYCIFIVVPESAEDTNLTLSFSHPEGNHIAVDFLKLSALCQSETFQHVVIDLKNRDGVVATCHIHSARQQRWVMGKIPEVPTRAFFEDCSTDPQSKFVYDYITQEVSRQRSLAGQKKKPMFILTPS